MEDTQTSAQGYKTHTSRSALTLLAAFIYIPVALLAAALLFIAVAPGSRFFALALVFLSPTLFLFASASRRSLRIGTIPFVLFLACLATSAVLSPAGSPAPGSPFSAGTFDGSAPNPPRLSPTNLVAEVDQLRLGTLLMPLVDRVIDRPQAKRLRDLTTAVYTDLHETSPGLAESGSQLGACYQDLFGPPRFQQHFFRYKPASADSPAPAIIFLHGSLGNFQAYIHLLKPVADQLGANVIAPTFGAGNWYRPESPQTIQNAIAYCQSQPDIDASNITLVGLSNGGIGVSRALDAFPGQFTSFVFLSPVIPTHIIKSVPPGTPVLVVHGTADRRIPLSAVESATAHLESLGADITTHLHEAEDHFLLFSKSETVTGQITAWLRDL